MRSKNYGFTLWELMMTLIISSGMIYAITKIIMNHAQENKVSILTEQTKDFSNAAVKYIKDNYFQIKTSLGSNTLAIIPWTTIVNADFQSLGDSNFNLYKQIPCVILYKDSPTQSNFIPLLFFVNTSTTITYPLNSKGFALQQQEFGSASLAFGASAGQIFAPNGTSSGINGIAYGINKAWSTASGVNLFSLANVNQCGGTNIINKSIVINLSMDSNYVIPTQDQSLQKVVSTSTAQNPNNISTSISFDEEYQNQTGAVSHKYHALVIGQNSVGKKIDIVSGLASGGALSVTGNQNQLNILNAGVVSAKMLNARTTLTPELTSCTTKEVGKKIKGSITQNVSLPVGATISGNLLCSYNSACPGGSTSPCYISEYRKPYRTTIYSCNPNTGACAPYSSNPNCTLSRAYIPPSCTRYSYQYNSGGNCHVLTNQCNAGTNIHTDGCQGSGGRAYVCGGCSTGGDPSDHNACWGQVCTNWGAETLAQYSCIE